MNDKRQEMLASESVGKLLWKLSLPAGIGMFVMALYNVIDTIFIGQVVGTMGIAGLSIVFPVQMIIMGMGMVVGIGGASLISRSLGARDFDKAERTLGNSILIAIILGILIPVIGLFNSSFWLRLFGASETVLPYAKEYMDIILIGTVFRVFAMGVSQHVRAEGNARVAMVSMIIGAVLNIILDAVFIIALGMGIKGAAIATVLSQVVTSLYLIQYFTFQNSSLKFHIKSFFPEPTVIREIIIIGFASFVRTTAQSLVIILVNRMLITYGGDIALAAYGIVHRTIMFFFMPLMAIGQGLQPVLGFSYGAKRFDRALTAIKLSIISATIFGLLAFLVIFFFPAPILRIFTTDVSLISIGSHAARLIFFASYLIGFQVVGSVVFQSIGKAVPTILTAMSRQILFLIPLIFILPRFFQLDGIWLSFPIADALSFVLTLVLLVHQLKGFRNTDIPVEEATKEIRPD